MAAKTGQAIKHNSPRGRELSRTHDYEQLRRSSGKKVPTNQEENPWLPSSRRSMLPERLPSSGKKVLTSHEEHPFVFKSRLSMLPEKLSHSGKKFPTRQEEQLQRSGQGRVRSKEQYKIDLFGASLSNRRSTQYLSLNHGQHLDDRASSTHVQHMSRRQATTVLIPPGEHKEQRTASVLCREDSSNHGQHSFSSKQLSICQDQGLSRSQRRLRYSTSQDNSESQVQPWVFSQQLNLTTTQNQVFWNGYQGHIRVDVNVMHHASPGLKELFSSTQQQRGPCANIGAMIDDIYNWISGK